MLAAITPSGAKSSPTVRIDDLLDETRSRVADVGRIGNEIVAGDLGEARSLGGHLNVLTQRLDALSAATARAGGIQGSNFLDQMAAELRPVARMAIIPTGHQHLPLLRQAEVGHAVASLSAALSSALGTLDATQLLSKTEPSPAVDASAEVMASAAEASTAADAAASAPPLPLDEGAGMPAMVDPDAA